jgi:hypothetical protein
MGEKSNAYRVFLGNLEERDHSEDLSIDGKVILEWVLKKYSGRGWLGLVWLRPYTSSGHRFHKMQGIV